MTVITLSRQLGSHGEEIATEIAARLSLRLIDAETINRAAQGAGVPPVALSEFAAESERGPVSQMLKALRTMPSLPSAAPFPATRTGAAGTDFTDPSTKAVPFSGLFSPTVPPISASLEGYMRMVGLVLRGLAEEGHVLILGRGGQCLLRDHPQVIHVQTVAPLSYRVRVVMDRFGLGRRAALSRVRASDRARYDYLKRYHDTEWLDPTLYHLVINTGRVPLSTATDLIVEAAGALQRRAVENVSHG